MAIEKRGHSYRVKTCWRGWPYFSETVPNREVAEAWHTTLELVFAHKRRDIMTALAERRLSLAQLHRFRELPDGVGALATATLTAVRAGNAVENDEIDIEAIAEGCQAGAFVDAFARWMEHPDTNTRRQGPFDPGTIKRYLSSWNRILAWLGCRPDNDKKPPRGQVWAARRAAIARGRMVDVRQLAAPGVLGAPSTLEAYRGYRRKKHKASDRTLKRDMDAVRTAWRFAEEKYAERCHVEWPSIKVPRTSDKGNRVVWIKPRALTALLDSMPEIWYELFAVLAWAGMRIGEAQALHWGDVKLEEKAIFVRGSHLKTKAAHRRIPLVPSLASLLGEMRSHATSVTGAAFVFDEERRNYEAARRAWRTGIRQMDARDSQWFDPNYGDVVATDLHIHDLRHSFAIDLVKAGVELPTVQRLLGHKSLRSTLKYLAYKDNEGDQQAMERLVATRRMPDQPHAWTGECA